jgi:hypothetical protein
VCFKGRERGRANPLRDDSRVGFADQYRGEYSLAYRSSVALGVLDSYLREARPAASDEPGTAWRKEHRKPIQGLRLNAAALEALPPNDAVSIGYAGRGALRTRGGRPNGCDRKTNNEKSGVNHASDQSEVPFLFQIASKVCARHSAAERTIYAIRAFSISGARNRRENGSDGKRQHNPSWLAVRMGRPL